MSAAHRAWAQAARVLAAVSIAWLPTSAAIAISAGAAVASAATDYASATWVPANTANYTVANRPHDHQVNLIVIHDIEGSASSGIRDFETAGYAASAHYIVSSTGAVTQMVREKDIAWHAGNWDYNTRAIGIEHAGYAYVPGTYTTAEYNASAALAASICSRWGVPMDRTHVIGHYQVPDPNNPGLYGGTDHHTDPGPYWNWTYYMSRAQADAAALPSPPHLGPDPVAVNGLTSVTVSWHPAQTCRSASAPITGYTLVLQPGAVPVDVPATATSYTFQNLTPETTYTVKVTAHNSYGDDSLTSNPATPGRCTTVSVTTAPASPQRTSTDVQLAASSTGCPNPRYQFWMLAPGATAWQLAQAYSATAVLDWQTLGKAPGGYAFSVWAQDSASPGNDSNGLGAWDAYEWMQDTLSPAPCASASVVSSPAAAALAGTRVTLTAAASGCPQPQFEFWALAPHATAWQLVQPYSPNPTLSWATAGKPNGGYAFSVWARDASSTGTAGDAIGRWDAYSSAAYTLTSIPCTGVTLSTAPSNGAPAGTAVVLTAAASGCPNPLYQFWLRGPGSATWRVAQPYSTAATLSWATGGEPAGSWGIAVWARDASSVGTHAGSLGSWDALAPSAYDVSSVACTGVSGAASPPATAPAGTSVTITATASGCASPQYELWILAPGSTTWVRTIAYSPQATMSWNTSGRPRGTYHLSIWARDTNSAGASGDALGRWDAYTSLTYQLT